MNNAFLAVKNLHKLHSQWTAVSRHLLKGYDITYPQYKVLSSLMELQQHNKRVTQSMLSQHSGIDVMTLSTIIRNLEARRLLRRQESRSDTRAKHVYLTSIGFNLIEEANPEVERAAEYFFEEFSPDLKMELCQIE